MATNPYQTPGAIVADQAEDYGEVKILSAAGRIGRVRYIGYSIGMSLLMYLVIGVFALLAGVTNAKFLLAVGMIVGGLGMLVIMVMLTVQRCHDFNQSGWLALLLIVPLVPLMFWLSPGPRRQPFRQPAAPQQHRGGGAGAESCRSCSWRGYSRPSPSLPSRTTTRARRRCSRRRRRSSRDPGRPRIGLRSRREEQPMKRAMLLGSILVAFAYAQACTAAAEFEARDGTVVAREGSRVLWENRHTAQELRALSAGLLRLPSSPAASLYYAIGVTFVRGAPGKRAVTTSLVHRSLYPSRARGRSVLVVLLQTRREMEPRYGERPRQRRCLFCPRWYRAQNGEDRCDAC